MKAAVTLTLILAELKRGLRSQLAYPLQAVSEVAGVGVVAALVACAPPDLSGDTAQAGGPGAAARLAGFMLAFVALAGVQVVHRVVREESDVGTLEQLCLSPFGLTILIGTRCLADTLRLAPLFLVAVALSSAPAGLLLRLAAAVVTALLMNMGMLGIGFVVGSVTLVFKRTGFVANLAAVGLLPLALTPSERLPALVQRAASMVPFTHAVQLARALVTGTPTPGLLANAGALCLSGAIWLPVGATIFRAAERLARAKGLLGKY